MCVCVCRCDLIDCKCKTKSRASQWEGGEVYWGRTQLKTSTMLCVTLGIPDRADPVGLEPEVDEIKCEKISHLEKRAR